jgi:hypothetical protein
MKGFTMFPTIEELVQIIREGKQDAANIKAALKPHQERLKELLQESGEKWKDESGYAMLTEPAERVTYDAKALDKLIASDPEQYGFLSDYRKATTGKPQLRVK